MKNRVLLLACVVAMLVLTAFVAARATRKQPPLYGGRCLNGEYPIETSPHVYACADGSAAAYK